MLPLLNSTVKVVLGDSKVPGVSPLFKVTCLCDVHLLVESCDYSMDSVHMYSLEIQVDGGINMVEDENRIL